MSDAQIEEAIKLMSLPSPAEVAEDKAEELANKIKAGKAIYQALSAKLDEEMVFAGKKAEEWREELRLNIPNGDLNPSILKALDVELMEKYHEASFYHAVAQAKASMIQQGAKNNYETIYIGIVEEYKKDGKRLPAATTLENLARIHNSEQDASYQYANIEVKFWKDVLDNLTNKRRLIENASLNISVELKAEQSGRMIDGLNNNHNSRRN